MKAKWNNNSYGYWCNRLQLFAIDGIVNGYIHTNCYCFIHIGPISIPFFKFFNRQKNGFSKFFVNKHSPQHFFRSAEFLVHVQHNQKSSCFLPIGWFFSYFVVVVNYICFQENAPYSMWFLFASVYVAIFFSMVVLFAIPKAPNHQIATGMRMQIASINWKINCCVSCLFLSYSCSIYVLVIHGANFRKTMGGKNVNENPWKIIRNHSFEQR